MLAVDGQCRVMTVLFCDVFRRQRGNDASGARQGHEPVFFGDGLMANPPGDEWDGSWHLEQK
jgi:hypothetical protein